ncbi:MAG TPA: cytochrome P450 [Solirubrobacterales bacterium]|jgi:cytochrome P450|nr:cytochrome P450 [Solirubrobacterales bacterium]
MEAATTSAPQPASRVPERGLPPSPPLPRPIQTAIWSRQARRLLYACQDRYGDMFALRIAYEGTWVMLADPAAIKQVFTGDPKVFHAGEGNQILEPVLGKSSVLVLDEKPHMSQRKLLLPPFHGARMQGYEQTMSEIAEREIDTWPTGTPYQLRPRMQAMTLEIILQTVFGVRGGERMGELRAALREFLDLTTNPQILLPLLLLGPSRVRKFPPFRRRVDRVDELIYREIAERRAAADVEQRDDVLSMLIAARHEDGSPMRDEEMRDELLTLLVAGHETTATSLSWAIERLTRNPDKLERLRAEVLDGREEYLTATIQETLRLRPVISTVLRKLTEAVEIGGYELPAGITVAPSIYLVHRNPEVYPEPQRFLPERFLDNPPGTYTWIPFGGGVRRCLGASFAQFEMAVVLKELVKRHQIRPANPKPERVFRRAITETPRHNAEVILG